MHSSGLVGCTLTGRDRDLGCRVRHKPITVTTCRHPTSASGVLPAEGGGEAQAWWSVSLA
jgi:hypothetical protein